MLLLLVLIAQSVVLTAVLVLFGAAKVGGLAAWGLVGLLPWAYIRQVRRAREALRLSVMDLDDEAEPVRGHFGRVQSLYHLRDAFRASRGGDGLQAEVSLRRVERADLGAWESRVHEAVRVLVCLDRGEADRAAQLAPLALPTGNPALDRRLGCLMIRAAWDNETRLSAIERGLYAAGGPLHDLVLLCRVRIDELAHGQILQSFAPRVCTRVSVAASEVGDERLALALLAHATGQGAYR